MNKQSTSHVATEKPSGIERARHILIIEDNPDGRDSLHLLLRLLGYRVEVASDGWEGVQKTLTSHPDVGLVDIGPPGLDGYEAARRLRSALGASTVLIAYIAYREPEDGEWALQAGFNVLLGKSAEPNRRTDLFNRA